MKGPISNPADCEVRGVIRFLQAEKVRPSEIHRRLVAFYGEYVMNAASDGEQCLGMGEQMFMTLRDQGDPLSSQTMSGSVSYSCVRNCHQTFAIPQNLCTLGQAAFWYEEGISKLVSRYDKCLNVQADYVEK